MVSTPEQDFDGRTPDLEDRTIVLTGATSGIGRRVAVVLADRGATVAAVGRNEERGRELQATAADAPGDIDFHRTDLADQGAVRELAAHLLATYDDIHALANNAGLASSERTESPDGIELTFAVNHLAPYLLTHELLPRLRESDDGTGNRGGGTAANGGGTSPARVVTTSSGLQDRGELDFDDLQFEAGYDGLAAYSRSKLANATFTVELAERLEAAGVDSVVANCFNPGFIRGTRIWLGSSWRSRLLTWLVAWAPGVGTDVETGAARLVEQLTAPKYGGRNGVYVDEGEESPPDPDARDEAVRRELWERSAELVGVDPNWPEAVDRER